MNWKQLFQTRHQRESAAIARERLQIIVAHQRHNLSGRPEFLGRLKQDLLEVLAKHVEVNRDQVSVSLNSHAGRSVLELNVTLPQDVVQEEPVV